MADPEKNGNADQNVNETLPAPTPSENGHEENGNEQRVGLGSLGLLNARGSYNPVKDMVTTSNDPAEYVPQAILTMPELKRNVRIMGEMDYVLGGSTDMDLMMWYLYAGSIAVEGQGRRDAVMMVTGGGRGMIGGAWDKAKGWLGGVGRDEEKKG